MGPISRLREYLKKRKQLKLDKSRESKIQEFNEKIESMIAKIMENAQLKTDKEIKDAVCKVLSEESDEAKSLGIIQQARLKNMIEYFRDNEYVKIVIRYMREEKEKERKVLKVLEKEKCERSYFLKMLNTQNPEEYARIYNEYVRDILNGDDEEVQKFRMKFETSIDFRKIDLINELRENIKFSNINEIPLFFDTTKEQIDESLNDDLAEKKLKGDVTAEDLVLVRTTNIFPMDNVVEPIGEYSGVEPMGTPLYYVIHEIDPSVKKDDFNILTPRYRNTSHWCMNGIVGDHSMGSFSGRDFLIIDRVGEHKDDEKLVGTQVSDVIYLGDFKLSKNAVIMMDIEKYKELMKDSKMKEQLGKIEVVLYKGDAEKAFKMYMNEKGYVWGDISSYHYDLDVNTSYDDKYLRKIEDSLKQGAVEGLEHSVYAGDSSLKITELKSERAKETFRKALRKTHEILGKEENEDELENPQDVTTNSMNKGVDDKYADDTLHEYMAYLVNLYPEMKEVYDSLKKCEDLESWIETVKPIVESVGIYKIREATRNFNEMMKSRTKEYRAKKDEDLLRAGLITEEEFKKRKEYSEIDNSERVTEAVER